MHAGENSVNFPFRLIADDGDATPCPDSGSEALRFVCFVLHSPACFPCFSLRSSGANGFRRMFQRGRSGLNSNRHVFLQSSAKNFPEPVTSAGCASDRTAVYRQARLNSRNCLIITTRLHIVNHCSTHRRKGRFQSFGFQSFNVSKPRIAQESGSLPRSLKLCNPETLKHGTLPSTLTVFRSTAYCSRLANGREEGSCDVAVPVLRMR